MIDVVVIEGSGSKMFVVICFFVVWLENKGVEVLFFVLDV